MSILLMATEANGLSFSFPRSDRLIIVKFSVEFWVEKGLMRVTRCPAETRLLKTAWFK